MFDVARIEVESPKKLGFERVVSTKELGKRLVESNDFAKIRVWANSGKLFFASSFEPNIGMIRGVADSGKSAFLVDLAGCIGADGSKKAIEISKRRFFLLLCKKYKAPFVLCSLAPSKWYLRNCHECACVFSLMGLAPEEIRKGFLEIGKYLEKTKAKKAIG
jgi:hypothetical protein